MLLICQYTSSVPFAFSPDGHVLATGNFDGKVKLWKGELRHVALSLSHGGQVQALAFSSNSNVLASAGHGQVVLWDLGTNQEFRRIPYVSQHPWMRLSFSPDNRTLAICNAGSVIMLWDWQADSLLGFLRGHEGPLGVAGLIESVRFSPDGRILASAGKDRTCRLWDVATLLPLAVLTNHAGRVTHASFSPDGQSLATTSDDGSVRLWEVATGREAAVARDSSGTTFAGSFAPEGQRLATGSSDGSVKLGKLPFKSKRAETYRLAAGTSHAEIWPEHRLLDFRTTNRTWHLWDLREPKEICQTSFQAAVLAFVFVPSRFKLFEYTSDRMLQFRTVPDGIVEPFLAHHLGDNPNNLKLTMSADARLVAAASRGRVWVWDATTKTELHQFQTSPLHYEYGLQFSPDAKSLLASSFGAKITLWRLATGRSATIPGHKTETHWPRFSRDGHRIATSNVDGIVKVRDVSTERELLSFNCGVPFSLDVGFSWDGNRLAIAGRRSGAIQIWDLESNRQVASMRAHDAKQMLWSVSFLDEDTMVSVSGDELRFWCAPSLADLEAEIARGKAR